MPLDKQSGEGEWKWPKERHGKLVAVSISKFYLPGYIRLTIRDEEGNDKQLYLSPKKGTNLDSLVGQDVECIVDDQTPKLVLTIRKSFRKTLQNKPNGERDVMYG